MRESPCEVLEQGFKGEARASVELILQFRGMGNNSLLEQRQVNLVSLRENIDTSTATGRCFLSMMGAIHQVERELRAERASAGRSSAKARGKTGGRPETDPAKLENARILYESSEKTAAEVCEIAGVGRRRFFSYIAEKRAE